MDEYFGLICFSIYPDLLYHINVVKYPNELWTLLEGFFGKKDEVRGYYLENEIINLSPSDGNVIQ